MFAKQVRIPPLDLMTCWAIVAVLILLPALYVELTGDFPGRVWFYGMDEDSWLAGVFLDAHTTMLATFASIQNFFCLAG